MDGPLVDEFALALNEMRIGESRSDALKKLAGRVGPPEIVAFVRAIIQADQLGISLGRILRVQATDTRLKRQAAAEERAMKAPIKMLFPTVALHLPGDVHRRARPGDAEPRKALRVLRWRPPSRTRKRRQRAASAPVSAGSSRPARPSSSSRRRTMPRSPRRGTRSGAGAARDPRGNRPRRAPRRARRVARPRERSPRIAHRADGDVGARAPVRPGDRRPLRRARRARAARSRSARSSFRRRRSSSTRASPSSTRGTPS